MNAQSSVDVFGDSIAFWMWALNGLLGVVFEGTNTPPDPVPFVTSCLWFWSGVLSSLSATVMSTTLYLTHCDLCYSAPAVMDKIAEPLSQEKPFFP